MRSDLRDEPRREIQSTDREIHDLLMRRAKLTETERVALVGSFAEPFDVASQS